MAESKIRTIAFKRVSFRNASEVTFTSGQAKQITLSSSDSFDEYALTGIAQFYTGNEYLSVVFLGLTNTTANITLKNVSGNSVTCNAGSIVVYGIYMKR